MRRPGNIAGPRREHSAACATLHRFVGGFGRLVTKLINADGGFPAIDGAKPDSTLKAGPQFGTETQRWDTRTVVPAQTQSIQRVPCQSSASSTAFAAAEAAEASSAAVVAAVAAAATATPPDSVLQDSAMLDPRVTDLRYFHTFVKLEALQSGEFTHVRKLGSGVNGEVMEHRWEQQGEHRTVAVKKIHMKRYQGSVPSSERSAHMVPWVGKALPEEDAQTEIGIMCYLAAQDNMSPYILRMLGAFSEDLGGRTWLVTELADGGDLFDLVASSSGRIAEVEVQRMLRQLLEALAYLHSHGIGHRDVSLENVLLKDGEVRLMDFGMAVRSHSDSGSALRYFRAVGKDAYRAPETYVPKRAKIDVTVPAFIPENNVVLVRSDDGYLCEVRLDDGVVLGQSCTAEVWGYEVQPCDIFSVAVCIFILCWQCQPWKKARFSDPLFAYIYSGGDSGIEKLVRQWQKPILSPEAMQLLGEMLQMDPAKRPTADACLGMPWVVETVP